MIEKEIIEQVIGFAELVGNSPDTNNPELLFAHNEACDDSYNELKDLIFTREMAEMEELACGLPSFTAILTDSEVEMINEIRKASVKKAKKEKLINQCLGIANEYKEWLRENNKVSTYSTFLDEYKYRGEIGRTPQDVYGIVKRILDRAEELVD